MPASARDAGARPPGLRFSKEMEAMCHISAEQKEILAHAKVIGGEDEEEEEEPQSQGQSQSQSQRGLQLQAGEGEGVDGIVMCSVPSTQTQPSSPSDDSSTSREDGRERTKPRKQRESRKSRFRTRKVRASTQIWPPSPTTPPLSPAPAPTTLTPRAPTTAPPPPPPRAPTAAPTPRAPAPTPTAPPAPAPAPAPALAWRANPSRELDPLARMVLMIPTPPLPTTGKDTFELACDAGIFKLPMSC